MDQIEVNVKIMADVKVQVQLIVEVKFKDRVIVKVKVKVQIKATAKVNEYVKVKIMPLYKNFSLLRFRGKVPFFRCIFRTETKKRTHNCPRGVRRKMTSFLRGMPKTNIV